MTSSFNGPSHDSCRYSISSANSSFCSGLSFSTHFALSNLFAGAEADAAGGAAGAESFALLKMEAVWVVVAVEATDCDGIGDVSSFAVDGEEGGAEDASGAEELEVGAT